jgi:hypothetical protein
MGTFAVATLNYILFEDFAKTRAKRRDGKRNEARVTKLVN